MNLELPRAARDLVARERTLLETLRTLLGRLDAERSDLDELGAALGDLEGVFMLVVCGEYNSGKSTLLNALLGAPVMLEGVTPTTDRITVVTYGDSARDVTTGTMLMRREYPSDLLRDLAIVDTPGTNAVIREHQELTERFVPRADLVLFVTSADRPFTESEREFLDLIRSWGKKVVMVVNKIDILERDDEREDVLEYVRAHARTTLGQAPETFGVEARRAFRQRKAGDGVAGTGLEELEAYIARSLAGSERVRLKLGNPLGVARRIAGRYDDVIDGRVSLLDDDRRTLDEVARQLTQFERDMQREFEQQLARVRTILVEVERRGEVFFDDVVRLRRVVDLMNPDRVRELFEARVLRDSDAEVDRAIADIVDWFLQRNLQLWEDVMGFVQERRRAGGERVIGEVGGRFTYDRDALIRALGTQAEGALRAYDGEAEGRRLANELQGAVVQSGILQVGGLGLGAAVLAFVSGALIDVTGVLAGLTLAGVGLLVLPRRRRQAKRELHTKMQELRDGLGESLGRGFREELRRSRERLDAALSPYTRFVRSELEHLESLRAELTSVRNDLESTARDIERLDDTNETAP